MKAREFLEKVARELPDEHVKTCDLALTTEACEITIRKVHGDNRAYIEIKNIVEVTL